jgi:hypothetical protein
VYLSLIANAPLAVALLKMQRLSKIRVHAARPVVDFWGRMMSRKRKLNDDAEFLHLHRVEPVGAEMVEWSCRADRLTVESFSKK